MSLIFEPLAIAPVCTPDVDASHSTIAILEDFGIDPPLVAPLLFSFLAKPSALFAVPLRVIFIVDVVLTVDLDIGRDGAAEEQQGVLDDDEVSHCMLLWNPPLFSFEISVLLVTALSVVRFVLIFICEMRNGM
jgi:hypothetical protein